MRLHVTDLDQLYWYQRIEDMTLDDLLARLRRESAPGRPAEIGTAWHKVLEEPPAEIGAVERDGFTFQVECDANIILPQVREIRAESTYTVDGVDVTLSGGCDGITGHLITDHKLTSRADFERYADSYQWRAYLDIYDADIFEYVLYHAKDEGDVIRILDIQSFRLYRYPEMRDDLLQGIRNMIALCRQHMPERLAA